MALGVVCAALWGCAQPRPEQTAGAWSSAVGESLEAVRLTGRVERGKQAYRLCSNCHLPSGVGIPDGTTPQLAGQHSSVLIKQMTDIRTGRRDNPIMYPFVLELDDPQELADLAAYIQSLPIPMDNGKGPGQGLERGRQLYEQNCASCHGERGQGRSEGFYPLLAGQHYHYLLRQITDIRDGRRRNAHPSMLAVVDRYDDDDLSAIADYISRLRWVPPGSAD